MSRFAMTGCGGRLAGALLPLLSADRDEWLRFSRRGGEGRLSYEQLDELPQASLDAMVHLAWSSLPVAAERDPSSAWTSDFPLIRRLLESGVLREGGQFVFFSSGGTVYGDTSGREVDEADPLRPVSQYGAAKVYAEHLVHQLCRRHGLRPVILRLTNPYGFRCESGIPQGVIGFALQAALNDRVFEIWGDGGLAKDYIHVSDVAAALIAVLSSGLDGTYNVSSGRSAALTEVLSLIERIAGRKIRTTRCSGMPWDVGAGTMVNRRLTDDSGWVPKLTLERGLAIEWMQLVGTQTV